VPALCVESCLPLNGKDFKRERYQVIRRGAESITMPNMHDIARMARVSIGTVSNVLSGSAPVREPLKARVLEAVAAIDYQPSQLARGLRRVKTNMIGMIIPDITNPFFPAVVRGAEGVAFANGLRLILCNTDNDHEKEIIHLNELRTYLPLGLIVIPSNFSEMTEQAASYRRAGAAVVCIDRKPRGWKGDTVTVANESGAHRAVRHLVRLGHTRIAMISGPLHLTNSQDRLKGFKRALRAANLSIRPEYIQETSYSKADGHSAAMILLRTSPPPTAIFAGNDLIALGALQAIRESGFLCPEEISLVGFDDLDISSMTNPPIFTVYQPGYELGATAMRLLLERIADWDGPPRHVVLQTELRIRESVAPPPLTRPAPSNSSRAFSNTSGRRKAAPQRLTPPRKK
jgi:DNA-binding LacI/PurR family transcriptional regulator